MITEDYVSFETAKLLRERGFDDEYTNAFYDKNGNLYFIDTLSDLSEHPDNDTDIAASTLYVAMKWLREVHNIFIQVELYSKYNDYWFELFQNTHRLMIEKREVYNSYEEACEAAIKYCLENLI